MNTFILIAAFIAGIIFKVIFPKDKIVRNYVNKYLIYLGLPLLVFVSLSKSRQVISVWHIVAIISFSIVSNISFYYYIKRLHLKRSSRSALFLCSVYGNTAYIGIPILYILFGSNGSAIASLFSLIILFFHYTLGLWIANYYSHGRTTMCTLMRSPFLWGLLIVFILSFFKIQIPSWISVVSEIGVLAAVFVVGAALVFKHLNFKIVKYTLLKLIIAPCIMLIIALVFKIEQFLALVLLAAMPSAFTNTSFAIEFKFDEKLTSSLTTIGTLLFMVIFFVFWLFKV